MGISRNTLINVAIMIIIVGFAVNIITNVSPSDEKIDLFPGVLGDMTLKNNETGKQVIANMMSYDDFRGYIIQGFKANYSGVNGTMTIFIAQMSDNNSVNKSFNDMIVQTGYNRSVESNQSIKNNATVIRLPVENPEIFVMQKNVNATWHFTFTKSDKVYWIGFSKRDIEYQANMLMEVYRNVDKEKNVLDV